VGTRCADHVTPLYPLKLALTSPTGGGRSVGIVRSRTKTTEFSFSFILQLETRWESVVWFTLRPFFTPGKRFPVTHWIRGWVVPMGPSAVWTHWKSDKAPVPASNRSKILLVSSLHHGHIKPIGCDVPAAKRSNTHT
jgi:hypothetical protein